MVPIFVSNILIQTLLHHAAGTGRGDVVEILVQNGANINEENVSGTILRYILLKHWEWGNGGRYRK
jgi:hypothetical protein